MQSAPGNGRTGATSSGELKPYFDLHFAETAFTRWVQSVGNRYRCRPPQAEESFDIDSTLRVLRRIERLSAISLQKRMRFGSKQVELRVNPVLAELRTAIEQSFKGIKVEPASLRHLLRTVWEAQQSQFLSEGLSAVTSIGGLSVGTKLSSAVLISPTILLTSRHVLPSVKKASEATVSFRPFAFGDSDSPIIFDLDPTTFFISDERLDVTIVSLASKSRSGYSAANIPFIPITADEGTTVLGEPLNLVHWSSNQAKLILRENRLLTLPNEETNHLAYYSSGAGLIPAGAALFNDQWELVAIHRTGVPRIKNGRMIDKDGHVWSGEDVRTIDWIANESVLVSAVAQLKALVGGFPVPETDFSELLRQYLPAPSEPSAPPTLEGRALGKALGPGWSTPQLSALPSTLAIDEGERTVDLLYATTRRYADNNEDAYFSGERTDAMTYGTAAVRIPEAHHIGKIELPFKVGLFSLTIYEEALDPQQHFVIRGVEVMPVDKWQELIRGSGLRHALLFVHGFNTTFREALYRLGQIIWDLQYSGVPVLFSWPSRGRLLDYLYDRDSALGARDAFITLLRNIRLGGIERIHILAHSMGNLVALDALAHHPHANDPLGIAEILMAAPDVDKNHFEQIAARVRAAASGMTLYASSADRALAASKRIAGDIPRAGDVPEEGPILIENIETIDVTPIGAEIFGLGHGQFAQTRLILNDIGLVIRTRTGARPPSARLIEIRGMPTGQVPPKWWRYAP